MSSEWKTEMFNYFKGVEMPKQTKDTSLRFCINCKSVWEGFTLVTIQFKKHPDMPTYGLQREKCPSCQ